MRPPTLPQVVLLITTFFLCSQAQAQTLVGGSRLVLGTQSNLSASVRLGDLDGDGDLDVVVANGRHWPQQNFVFFNQGSARFPVMRPLGTDQSTTYACELADLDGDGDLDIVTGNDMALGKIFLNDGKGNFEKHASFGVVSSLRSLTVADIDSDGDADILATCRGRENRICLNDGNARFKDGGMFGAKDDSTIDVAVADVNGDGHQDLVLANRDGQPNQWLLNDGKLGFEEKKPFGDPKSQSRAVAVGDLNGDGALDWVVGNIDQKNTVFLGDGKGSIKQQIEFGSDDSRTYTIALADINNDQVLDVVAGNAGQRNSVFFNNGDATGFREESFGGVSNATYGLSVGDLNGDRLADVVVANSSAQNFLFLNRFNRSVGESTQTKPEKNRSVVGLMPEAQEKTDGENNEAAFRKLQKYHSSDWPSFRGTGGRGVAEGFPLRTKWNANASAGNVEGVLWETGVPGLGHSSPVVFGDKIFLTTAVARDGKAPLQVAAGGKPTAADDNGEQDWLLLCYDKTTGKELWRKTARTGKPRATRHAKATHANTSVCVDGKHVLAFFGSEGIFCYDVDGQLLWSRDLGVINISKYGIGWGFASSPAIQDDRIAIVCDDPSNPYVAALSLSDGEELWRTSRKEICERSWGTPLIHQQNGKTQVVVNGWPWILSYDLESGKELWRIEGGGDNPIPTPFEAHGWLYITNAHGGPAPIYVIEPEARGNLSVASEAGDEDDSDSSAEDSTEAKSNRGVVWRSDTGGSYMSTPVVYGDYLYLGNSNGVIRCFNAKTGEVVYEKRLGRKAGVIASLVAGDGKIYCASENGSVLVVAAGPEFKILATNDMKEPCLATPAISEGVMIYRTTKRLIAIK